MYCYLYEDVQVQVFYWVYRIDRFICRKEYEFYLLIFDGFLVVVGEMFDILVCRNVN